MPAEIDLWMHMLSLNEMRKNNHEITLRWRNRSQIHELSENLPKWSLNSITSCGLICVYRKLLAYSCAAWGIMKKLELLCPRRPKKGRKLKSKISHSAWDEKSIEWLRRITKILKRNHKIDDEKAFMAVEFSFGHNILWLVGILRRSLKK